MLANCGRSPDTSNTRRVRISALLAALLLVTNAQAQHRVPLTLAEAEDLALQHEPGKMVFEARALSLQDEAVAAGQLPDPVLRIGLANFPISGGGFSTEGMTQAQLGLRQAFPRVRVRSLETDKLHALSNAQSESADARARDVLAHTRADWLEAYYWQRAGNVLVESRPYFEELVAVTQSLYAVGRKSQHDVLRADLELTRLADRIIEAERSHAAAQAALSRWLGDDAYRPAAQKLPDWGSVPPLHDLHSALAVHPLLRAADANIAAQQSGVDLAIERKKPGWALDLGYGYREGFLPSGEPRSDFVSLSVTVDLPVFRRNRQDKKITAALNERRAVVEEKGRLLAVLQSQLALQYSRWTELTQRLALYENKMLGLSASQAEAALLEYQNDRGDFADVMLGEIEHLNTRLAHIRLQVDRAQSYAALASLGGMSQ